MPARKVLPLEELPIHIRQRIAEELARPQMPKRYLLKGGDDRPLAMIESRAWYERQKEIRRERKKVKRQQIIARDGLACRLCGGEIADESEVEIDHILPRVLGGPTEPANLQVTHKICNRRKGAKVWHAVGG
jgi:hypothetical protein